MKMKTQKKMMRKTMKTKMKSKMNKKKKRLSHNHNPWIKAQAKKQLYNPKLLWHKFQLHKLLNNHQKTSKNDLNINIKLSSFRFTSKTFLI